MMPGVPGLRQQKFHSCPKDLSSQRHEKLNVLNAVVGTTTGLAILLPARGTFVCCSRNGRLRPAMLDAWSRRPVLASRSTREPCEIACTRRAVDGAMDRHQSLLASIPLGATAAFATGVALCARVLRQKVRRNKAASANAVGIATTEIVKDGPGVATSGTTAGAIKSVRRLAIKPEDVQGFQDAFFESIETDKEFLWNAMKDPVWTERMVCKCYKRAVTWLPQEVLDALLHLFVDPAGPPALWISGLPVDPEIPPTPALPGDFRLPICESWLLGMARVLGVPYGMLGFYTGNSRGGLVRDLAPKPGLGGINNPKIDLGFHRDVPACISGEHEPDGFLLLAARGDPNHSAKTLVCSHAALAAGLSPEEIAALRRSPVRVECVRDASGASTPYGRPWYAVTGPEADPMITLFYIPAHRDFTHRIVSDDAETQSAYSRAEEVARQRCDEVDLQAGDVLVINNARCNHGRTAFEPRLDGSDRWLLKTFVHAAGWRRPSQMSGDALPMEFPSTLLAG